VPVFEKFNMPDAGEGLTEAEVVVWHVSVGDRVEVNQPLLRSRPRSRSSSCRARSRVW